MLRLTARGKINWTLDILGAREDGYHLMDMLMTSVDLADTLEMEAAPELSLSVFQDGGVVPGDERNLVWKAALALQKAAGCAKGAALRLHKRVPVGAGMGGGSSDAAAALIGLGELWGITISREQLMELALSLGADVPFLLFGGLARVRGIGEILEPLPPPPQAWLVLVQPCKGLSTPEVFSGYDAMNHEKLLRPQTDRAQKALEAGDWRDLAKAMGNVLEPVSLSRRAEMKEALTGLEAAGALRAMMTGSGSVVYGLFPGEEKARAAYAGLHVRWEKTYIVKTEEKSILRG